MLIKMLLLKEYLFDIEVQTTFPC